MNDGMVQTAADDDAALARRFACEVMSFGAERPLVLDSGVTLGPVTVAYKTYGTLNAARSNAVLICHALTGDQHVASRHPITGREGWWELMIGPGRPFDTNRFFVICPNVLGGCMGTSGPASIDPSTGEAYAVDFPVFTIADMVRLQAMLLDHLCIEQLFCVTGGSMGGMQVLEWGSRYPERVFSAVPVATAAAHTAQNIAFQETGRQAIMSDPHWHGGHYRRHGVKPVGGLAAARMVAHITYLSEASLHAKFGRQLQDRQRLSFSFDADFQVESYLRYQGSIFVQRFDANSYLYITRAMDYFDLVAAHGGVLAAAFRASPTRWLVLSFTSDWLYPTRQNLEIVAALKAAGAEVEFREIESDLGHDSFLLDVPELFRAMRDFLDRAAAARGLAPAAGGR